MLRRSMQASEMEMVDGCEHIIGLVQTRYGVQGK
jgi:hypothetical protein